MLTRIVGKIDNSLSMIESKIKYLESDKPHDTLGSHSIDSLVHWFTDSGKHLVAHFAREYTGKKAFELAPMLIALKEGGYISDWYRRQTKLLCALQAEVGYNQTLAALNFAINKYSLPKETEKDRISAARLTIIKWENSSKSTT